MKCKKCNFETESKSTLLNHYKNVHCSDFNCSCEYCGKQFNIKSSYSNHFKHCKEKHDERENKLNCLNENLCFYGCGKPATTLLNNNKYCCSNNYNSCSALKEKNKRSHIGCYRNLTKRRFWSKTNNTHPHKGKTYVELFGNEKAESIINKISSVLKTIPNLGKGGTEEIETERKRKLSEKIKQRYANGWMPKAGRCKKIKYTKKDNSIVSLDGSWELKVATYFDNNDINWTRNTKRFEYINLKGTKSYYTPDFYLIDDNKYIEVKGYETDLDRCKWNQFKEVLEVWRKEDLKRMKIL